LSEERSKRLTKSEMSHIQDGLASDSHLGCQGSFRGHSLHVLPETQPPRWVSLTE
jgi:hypothetical protein